MSVSLVELVALAMLLLVTPNLALCPSCIRYR